MFWPFTVTASGSAVAVGVAVAGTALAGSVALAVAGTTCVGGEPCVSAAVPVSVAVGPGWLRQAASRPNTVPTQTKHQPVCRRAAIKPLPNFIDWPHYTPAPTRRNCSNIRLALNFVHQGKHHWAAF